RQLHPAAAVARVRVVENAVLVCVEVFVLELAVCTVKDPLAHGAGFAEERGASGRRDAARRAAAEPCGPAVRPGGAAGAFGSTASVRDAASLVTATELAEPGATGGGDGCRAAAARAPAAALRGVSYIARLGPGAGTEAHDAEHGGGARNAKAHVGSVSLPS